jgi:ribosome biogenesis GTPase A
MVTVAMIGHPNVGKSAVLNALMGAHVVSVKGTPGHTKHIHTSIWPRCFSSVTCSP